MLFIRFVIIALSAILIFSGNSVFAASGSGVSASTGTKNKTIVELPSPSVIENAIEDKKTEKNAQKIILEVYKIQWNKILKDMDVNIEKVNPDPKVRIDVYSGIRKTLEFRKQRLEKMDLSEESKDILSGYIEYMIVSIDKKIKNLE